jgi:hypothetical protein
MVDAVVGENDQRAFRAQTSRQNPGGGRAHLPQRVLVSDRGPCRGKPPCSDFRRSKNKQIRIEKHRQDALAISRKLI